MSKNRHKRPQQQIESLEVLFPDKQISIADKTFTMRELRFGEQLQYAHLLQPIAQRFDSIDLESDPEDAANKVLDLLSLEYERVMQLMAICSRQSINWIKSLPPERGEDLLFYWWSVNSHFFIRRQLRKGQVKVLLDAAKNQETGQTYSPPLSE